MSDTICEICSIRESTIECIDCAKGGGKQESSAGAIAPVLLCQTCGDSWHQGRMSSHKYVLLTSKQHKTEVRSKLDKYLSQTKSIDNKISELGRVKTDLLARQQIFVRNIQETVTSVQSRLKDKGMEMVKKLKEHDQAKFEGLQKSELALKETLDEIKKIGRQVEVTLRLEHSMFEQEIEPWEAKLTDVDTSGLIDPLPSFDTQFTVDYRPINNAVEELTIKIATEEPPADLPLKPEGPIVPEPGVSSVLYTSSRLTSKGTFWAQIAMTPEENEYLDRISYSIRSDYIQQADIKPYSEIDEVLKVGDLCFARYQHDFKWYRGKIEEIKGDKADVRFLDYGNFERVNLTHILPYKHTPQYDFPFRSVECCLFAHLDSSLAQQARWDFVDIVSHANIKATFKNKVADTDIWYINMDLVLLDDGSEINANDHIMASDAKGKAPSGQLKYTDIRLQEGTLKPEDVVKANAGTRSPSKSSQDNTDGKSQTQEVTGAIKQSPIKTVNKSVNDIKECEPKYQILKEFDLKEVIGDSKDVKLPQGILPLLPGAMNSAGDHATPNEQLKPKPPTPPKGSPIKSPHSPSAATQLLMGQLPPPGHLGSLCQIPPFVINTNEPLSNNEQNTLVKVSDGEKSSDLSSLPMINTDVVQSGFSNAAGIDLNSIASSMADQLMGNPIGQSIHTNDNATLNTFEQGLILSPKSMKSDTTESTIDSHVVLCTRDTSPDLSDNSEPICPNEQVDQSQKATIEQTVSCETPKFQPLASSKNSSPESVAVKHNIETDSSAKVDNASDKELLKSAVYQVRPMLPGVSTELIQPEIRDDIETGVDLSTSDEFVDTVEPENFTSDGADSEAPKPAINPIARTEGDMETFKPLVDSKTDSEGSKDKCAPNSELDPNTDTNKWDLESRKNELKPIINDKEDLETQLELEAKSNVIEDLETPRPEIVSILSVEGNKDTGKHMTNGLVNAELDIEASRATVQEKIETLKTTVDRNIETSKTSNSEGKIDAYNTNAQGNAETLKLTLNENIEIANTNKIRNKESSESNKGSVGIVPLMDIQLEKAPLRETTPVKEIIQEAISSTESKSKIVPLGQSSPGSTAYSKVFKNRVKAVGTSFQASVTSQLEKNATFWATYCHDDKAEELFEIFKHDLIKSAQMMSPPKPVAPGQLHLGLDSQKQWARVKVTSIPNEDWINVDFIDLGKSSSIHASTLRRLPNKFLSIPWQSVKCQLKIPESVLPEISVGSARIFQQLTAGKQLQFVVEACKKENPVVVTVLDTLQNQPININSLTFKDVTDPETATTAEDANEPKKAAANYRVPTPPEDQESPSKESNTNSPSSSDADIALYINKLIPSEQSAAGLHQQPSPATYVPPNPESPEKAVRVEDTPVSTESNSQGVSGFDEDAWQESSGPTSSAQPPTDSWKPSNARRPNQQRERNDSDGSRSQRECFNCNQKGHQQRDCQLPRRQQQQRRDLRGDRKGGYRDKNRSQRGGGGKNTYNCYSCGQSDHIAKDCPTPKQ
ncbi:unnamed protein product [Owenia fusiformis]|uniref:Uncharacterized protein n=1 Tax=Owenia fusiformis TaxID=6347 RepID=A0A8J1TXU3_OWEFU|nr:unnamed protein product [Owenia fusiformis]